MDELTPGSGIVITEKYNPYSDNLESVSYDWKVLEDGKGDPRVASYSWYQHQFRIEPTSPANIKLGTKIVAGSLRLMVVDRGCGDYVYVMRDGWRASLRWRWRKVRRVLEIFRSRLIITAAVWGLATVGRGTVPVWKDIHLLGKLRDTWFNVLGFLTEIFCTWKVIQIAFRHIDVGKYTPGVFQGLDKYINSGKVRGHEEDWNGNR